jgi:hypothetical protein
MADVLTPAKKEIPAFSGILIAYELAARFLTEQFLGDACFVTKYP